MAAAGATSSAEYIGLVGTLPHSARLPSRQMASSEYLDSTRSLANCRSARKVDAHTYGLTMRGTASITSSIEWNCLGEVNNVRAIVSALASQLARNAAS